MEQGRKTCHYLHNRDNIVQVICGTLTLHMKTEKRKLFSIKGQKAFFADFSFCLQPWVVFQKLQNVTRQLLIASLILC